MNEGEIFSPYSLFFSQILDNTQHKGIILSYQIMQRINRNELHKMLECLDLQLIKFEKYDHIQLYVLSSFEEDQIWIVRYHDGIILMFSSDY